MNLFSAPALDSPVPNRGALQLIDYFVILKETPWVKGLEYGLKGVGSWALNLLPKAGC